jgi:hypothetical protein
MKKNQEKSQNTPSKLLFINIFRKFLISIKTIAWRGKNSANRKEDVEEKQRVMPILRNFGIFDVRSFNFNKNN